MKIKTVIISKYPIFKEGLKRILGPEFAIISYFDSVSEFLATNIEVEVTVLDEEVARDLDLLKKEHPTLTVFQLNLEDNTGYLYNGISSTQVHSAIRGLKDRFLVKESS